MGISLIYNWAIKFLRLLLSSDPNHEQTKNSCEVPPSKRSSSPNELHAYWSEPNGRDPSFYFLVFWHQISLIVKRIRMYAKEGSSIHGDKDLNLSTDTLFRCPRMVSGHLPAREAFIDCGNLHAEYNFA